VLTKWVGRLIGINVALYMLGYLPGTGQLLNNFVLVPGAEFLVRPWTLVTYAFLHGGFMHLLFNMIGLFFFGPRLEDRLGSRSFLQLYAWGVIGGAVFHFLPLILGSAVPPVIGASGAIYGIVICFAMLWPRERIYLWMVVPVPAWLLASVLVFGALFAGITAQSGSNVAHLAHFGGALCAGVYLRTLRLKYQAKQRQYKAIVKDTKDILTKMTASEVEYWSKVDLDTLHAVNREEVERLLAKARQGDRILTGTEVETLRRLALQLKT